MAQSHCDLSVGNILPGTRRRLRSKSESEFENPPVARDRASSLSRVEPLIDGTITPSREMFSQPIRNDEFLETPLGLGRSTRLDEGRIQPDWDTIDTDLNYLEAISKKHGTAPTTLVKLNYDRLMLTLVQTERSFIVAGQFGDIPAVDQRKNRLYRTKEYRIRPILFEDYAVPVVKGVDSLITGLEYNDSQETRPPGIDRGECGRTRVDSNAASQVVDSD